MIKIYKLGDDILRQKAEPVAEVTDEIKKLTDDMFEAMLAKEGVGLAGPQVGKNLRLFVVVADDKVRRVFINPQIIATSDELGDYEEGCLSIPGVYEKIRRPVRVTVQALNERGRPFTLNAEGLLARIIQHEIDHLNGILFIDRGDPDFAEKIKRQFKRQEEKIAKKKIEHEARQRRIAEQLAHKEARRA